MLKYIVKFLFLYEDRNQCSYYSIFVEFFLLNNVDYYDLFWVVSSVGVDILITHSNEMHNFFQFIYVPQQYFLFGFISVDFCYANADKKL